MFFGLEKQTIFSLTQQQKLKMVLHLLNQKNYYSITPDIQIVFFLIYIIRFFTKA